MKILNDINLNKNKLENTTVLITEGGTGATSAEQALQNLSGVNIKLVWKNPQPSSPTIQSDITGLSGLSNAEDGDLALLVVRMSTSDNREKSFIGIVDGDYSVIHCDFVYPSNGKISAFYRRALVDIKNQKLSLLASWQTTPNEDVISNDACIPLSLYIIKNINEE